MRGLGLRMLCCYAIRLRDWLNLIRIEEETMSGLAQQAEVATRVIVQHYADMLLAFIILLKSFDHGNLPGKRKVDDVSAFAGLKPDAISSLDLNSCDGDMVQ